MSSESEWEPPATAEDSESDWEPPRKKRKLNNTTKKATKSRSKKTKKRIVKAATIHDGISDVTFSITTSSTSKVIKPPRRSRRRRARNPLSSVRQCPPLPDVVSTQPQILFCSTDSEDDIEILEPRTRKTRGSKTRRTTRGSKTRRKRNDKNTTSTSKSKTKSKSSKSKSKTMKRKSTSKSSKSSKSAKTSKQPKSSKAPRRSSKFKPGPEHVVNIRNLDTLICGFFRSLISRKSEKQQANAMPLDVTNLVDKYQENILYFKVNFVWTHKYACCSAQSKCKTLKRNRGNYVFEREPNNEYDRNAIKIMTHSEGRVGHVPREQAAILAALMDNEKIELKSVGGLKRYNCQEMVEIVPRVTLTEREMTSLRRLPLENMWFDQNRYVSAFPRSLTM